jgi:GNAT superfamily N-acetyltransferase
VAAVVTVNVRPATARDQDVLRELWTDARAELPLPVWLPVTGWDAIWPEMQSAIAEGAVVLALSGDAVAGVAWAGPPLQGRARLELVYVRPAARRQGAGRALVDAARAMLAQAGASSVSLDVPDGSPGTREIWRRLGLEQIAHVMAGSVTSPATPAAPGDAKAGSHAVLHAKTGDHVSVERAVAQFIPRLADPVLGAESGGWIRVHAPQLDADREAQGRLAGDISDRLDADVVVLGVEEGAVVRYRIYERGLLVDEYLSVPEYYGELSRVDQLGFVANPTIVSRVTGAPFDDVRRIARTAPSPAELPDAEELYRQIAALMRLDP